MAGTMVYLVGAGPGDPDLITVRGLDAIRQADVVVYDRLVSTRLLGEAHAGAELIYAGKATGRQALTQDGINRLLVQLARDGRTVCRLKGGDPFVFGRGGEEAEALAAAGVAFTVVPGVTSAVAVPAAAGIPVTYRGTARSFTVITGHVADGSAGVDWEAAARLGGTLVILMAVANLAEITGQLIAGGMDPATPAAVIERGTMPGERTVTAPLASVAAQAAAAGLAAPSVVVVGDVVSLSAVIGAAQQSPPPLAGRAAG